MEGFIYIYLFILLGEHNGHHPQIQLDGNKSNEGLSDFPVHFFYILYHVSRKIIIIRRRSESYSEEIDCI